MSYIFGTGKTQLLYDLPTTFSVEPVPTKNKKNVKFLQHGRGRKILETTRNTLYMERKEDHSRRVSFPVAKRRH